LRDDVEDCMLAYRLPLEVRREFSLQKVFFKKLIFFSLSFKENTDNNLNLNANVRFFRNEIKSRPMGDYLNNILKNYWGDYGLLERKHDYVQWLFPLRTLGMNSYSQELQLHELETLKKDELAVYLLLQSYQMMLDFYGMKLKSTDSREVIRAKNYRERYENLIK
jgi:hypothetical protein